MSGLNRFVGMGRLTSDPELKCSSSGIEYCGICIAVDRYTKKDAEKVTDFISCKAWRATAVFISKYFHKGDMIAIEGALQSSKYENKDGVKITKWEINIDQFYFCGSKNSGAGGTTQMSQDYASSAPSPSTLPVGFEEIDANADDDLPF